jgi:predicted SprT family Zn-dependent metalloprotease
MSENINLTGDTNVELKKKGRKPTTTNYFDVREELAVVRFLESTSYEEKNKIYNEFLKKPLDKMISSIIRRYKLYRKDMDFTDIHVDTHSFLMTKIDKFKPSREKKAYSYFGTICKNYLMGQILKDQKETNRKISYEDISGDLENAPQMIYYLDIEQPEEVNLIPILINYIKEIIEENELKESELKLGL